MIERILCKYGLPLAVTVAACQPPEEASTLDGGGADANVECSVIAPAENHCAGDALFCDDFDGPQIDERKWESNGSTVEYTHFENGIMNITIPRGAIILHSRPSYALDDRTYVLEARWKVGERGKTNFAFALDDQQQNGRVRVVIGTGTNSALSGIGTTELKVVSTIDEFRYERYAYDVTQFHVTSIQLNRKRVTYCVDGVYLGRGFNHNVTDNTNIAPEISCTSDDSLERTCFLDYVRLNPK